LITAALIAMMVVMVIAFLRAWLGPSLYDRILAINTFGTATVLAIAILGFYMQRPAFMDIALLYSLINFIGTVAILKIYRFDDLAHSDEEES
jgi:multicomponent Na+:H+ antiporter subunit F|tara:strand:+ start:670 stop:945 length:276 start_codon:yes stop_codon:yes gene_type:complete